MVWRHGKWSFTAWWDAFVCGVFGLGKRRDKGCNCIGDRVSLANAAISCWVGRNEKGGRGQKSWHAQDVGWEMMVRVNDG